MADAEQRLLLPGDAIAGHAAGGSAGQSGGGVATVAGVLRTAKSGA